MRLTAKVLFALVILLAAPAAFAQVLGGDGDEVQSMVGISDGCGDTMSADECMASGSALGTCINDYCPACGFNNTMTAATCYRLKGNTGYCSCQAAGITRDRWGQPMPVCKTSGFCASHPI